MSKSRHHLAEIIGERSLHVDNFKALAKEVAAYLLETGRSDELESLMRDVMAYRAAHGVVEVTTLTAHPLSDQDLVDIRAILKQEYPHAKKFTIDQQQSPEVVGGVLLSMPGEQLDLSVRGTVNKFKRLTLSGGM